MQLFNWDTTVVQILHCATGYQNLLTSRWTDGFILSALKFIVFFE